MLACFKDTENSNNAMFKSKSQRQFAFSPGLSLLALGLLALMLSLGRWQLNKADARRVQLQSFADVTDVLDLDSVSEMPQRYSLVALHGEYDSERQIIMDGFSKDKRAGYQVLTPFRLRNSEQVLMVNRGWRLWEGLRNDVQGLAVATGQRRLVGRAERFWRPGMTLGDGNRAELNSWPQLAVYPSQTEIAEWLQQEVAPWQLLLDAEQSDGFVREWKPGGLSPARHQGYAWQWFALSATLCVLYVVASWRPVGPKEGHNEKMNGPTEDHPENYGGEK